MNKAMEDDLAKLGQALGRSSYISMVKLGHQLGWDKGRLHAAVKRGNELGMLSLSLHEVRYEDTKRPEVIQEREWAITQGDRVYAYVNARKAKAMSRIRCKALGKLLEYDEERHEADFVVSTQAPDRDGDTVDQESLDWSEFDVNPTMTLSHDTETIPVGKWLSETRHVTKIVDPGSGDEVAATVMRGRFNVNTKGGKEVALSVKGGFLGAASVSFLPQEGSTQKNSSGGSHYERAKVTEVAVCAVPANQGATRAVEMVLKSLRQKADSTRISGPGGAQYTVQFEKKTNGWYWSSPDRQGERGPFSSRADAYQSALEFFQSGKSLKGLNRRHEVIYTDKSLVHAGDKVKILKGDGAGKTGTVGIVFTHGDVSVRTADGSFQVDSFHLEKVKAKSMTIKFWRYKSANAIRILRKDLPAMADIKEAIDKIPEKELIALIAGKLAEQGSDPGSPPEVEAIDEPIEAAEAVDWEEEETAVEKDVCPECGGPMTEEEAEQNSGICSSCNKSKSNRAETLADATAERALELSKEMESERPRIGHMVRAPDGFRGQLEEIQGSQALVRSGSGTVKWYPIDSLEVQGKSADRDDAIEAALEERGVPKAMRPAVRKMALARVKKAQAEAVKKAKHKADEKRPDDEDKPSKAKDCSGLPGYKYLKAAIDNLEQGLGDVEQKDIQAGVPKIIKQLKQIFAKAYGKDAYPGDQEEQFADDEDPDVEEKEQAPVEVDGKWAIYDPTTDEYVGEFASEEEARRGIADMAKPEEVKPEEELNKSEGYSVGDKIVNVYSGDTGVVTRGGDTGKIAVKWDKDGKETLTPIANIQKKSWPRRKAFRKQKALNKATKAAIGDAVEFMEGCSQSKDLPKHLKSGHLHHAAALKALIEASTKAIRIGECPLCEEQWSPSDEQFARENEQCPYCEGTVKGPALDKANDNSEVKELFKAFNDRMQNVDIAMQRKYGQMWNRTN